MRQKIHEEEPADADFMAPAYILRYPAGFRWLATYYEPGTLLHTAHAQRAVHLLGALVCLDACWVTRVLYDDDSGPTTIALTIAAFFRRWLAARCFVRCDFNAYYAAVRDLLREHITPKNNLWRQFYQRQYSPL